MDLVYTRRAGAETRAKASRSDHGVYMQHDCGPNNAVIGGVLTGKYIIKVERIRAVTPGSSLHFQISYIAAAALPPLLSKYNLFFLSALRDFLFNRIH